MRKFVILGALASLVTSVLALTYIKRRDIDIYEKFKKWKFEKEFL